MSTSVLPFRTRRPCDRCRRSKVRCSIALTGPPCSRCSEAGYECTFDTPAPRRKAATSTAAAVEYPSRWEEGSRGSRTPMRTRSRSPTGGRAVRGVSHGHNGEGSSEPSRPTRRGVGLPPENTAETAFRSAEYEPNVLIDLLTDDLLPVSDPEGRYIKQISSEPSQPVYVIMEPRSDLHTPAHPHSSLTHIRALISRSPAPLSESSLLQTYFNLVHPALPIISLSAPMTPQLRATVLVTALSHGKGTRPLAALGVGILAMGTKDRRSLDGIAGAVLEINSRPALTSRWQYVTLASTIAEAQLQGLHLDPSSWTLSPEERELRVRLWWALVIHDAWMSLMKHRPSHIQDFQHTVRLPEPVPDISDPTSHPSSPSSSPAATTTSTTTSSFSAFKYMCRLCLLVRRLQSTMTHPHRSLSDRRALVSTLRLATDSLLSKWDAAWGRGEKATGAVGFVLLLLGFRGFLQRLEIELDHGLGDGFVPQDGMVRPFMEIVEFLETLDQSHLDGYFLIYTQAMLQNTVTSLIRLALVESAEALSLLSRLIVRLKHFSNSTGWDIADLALKRAAGTVVQFSSMGEYAQLCAALQGRIEFGSAGQGVGEGEGEGEQRRAGGGSSQESRGDGNEERRIRDVDVDLDLDMEKMLVDGEGELGFEFDQLLWDYTHSGPGPI